MHNRIMIMQTSQIFAQQFTHTIIFEFVFLSDTSHE